MQKTNINASILIWSIFLSLIISLGFISISTKIHQNIQNNIDFQNTIKQNISSTGVIVNADEISVKEDEKSLTIWMKKNESKQFSFLWSSQEFINIELLNGWPVEVVYNNSYRLVNESYSFSGNTSNVDITVNNLSWYALLQISSSANIQKDDNGTVVWKKIWNQNIIKQYPQ